MLRVGVISDTHGLLRAEALKALEPADVLIHAGDIGTAEVLDALGRIAPLFAVRGNNDHGPWARALPVTDSFDLEGVRVHLLHDVNELAAGTLDPNVRVVVSGHSHMPKIEWRDAILYLNPGSAGPRRFRLPTTVAWMDVDGSHVSARLVELTVHTSTRGR